MNTGCSLNTIRDHLVRSKKSQCLNLEYNGSIYSLKKRYIQNVWARETLIPHENPLAIVKFKFKKLRSIKFCLLRNEKHLNKLVTLTFFLCTNMIYHKASTYKYVNKRSLNMYNKKIK